MNCLPPGRARRSHSWIMERVRCVSEVLIIFASCAFATGCAGLGDKEIEGTPTWEGEIRSLMGARCAICHTNPPQNGAPTGFRYDKYLRSDPPDADAWDGAYEKRERILQRAVITQTMPPTGPISGEERALLEAWIEAGAPER